MYALLAVQDAHKRDPHFLMCDLAYKLCSDHGISRATAFRQLRTAIDILCISYEEDQVRRLKKNDHQSAGLAKARMCRYPNGLPGRMRKAA